MSQNVKVCVMLTEDVVELLDDLCKLEMRKRSNLVEALVRERSKKKGRRWDKGLDLNKDLDVENDE